MRLAPAVALACCAAPLAAVAQGSATPAWAAWDIAGSNTLRLERIRLRGPGPGPLPFPGSHGYDEFSLTMNRAGLYDLTRLQLSGVVNGSDYRSPERGLVPERLHLTVERGDAGVPFRLQAGDVFGYFSYRTLQRPLKGGQLELQPAPLGGWRQSWQLLAGLSELDWRDLDTGRDRTTGLSWLLDNEVERTRLGLHVVGNHREADAAAGTLTRGQRTFSLTGERAFDVGDHIVRGEGELAWFRGDHDGIAGPASGQGRRDRGAFVQFTGSPTGSPLGYRFRFERYGADFRPAGGLVTPDHAGREAHVSWRLPSGLTWRGRLLDFRDDLESGNRLVTRSAGLNLTGPLWGASGSLDLLRDRQHRDDRSVDHASWNLLADASVPLAPSWLAQATWQWQAIDDRVLGARGHRRYLRAGLVWTWLQGAWFGSLAPGFTWRRETGLGQDLREIAPALLLTAVSGPHQLSANVGQQRLRFGLAPANDTLSQEAGIAYRYLWGLHQFGIEWGRWRREVETPGNDNRTARVALTWTVQFDRPATVRRADSGFIGAPAVAPTGPIAGDLGPITAVAPGAPLELTLQRLAAAGLRGGVPQGPWTVFEHRLLPELAQRQRVVLEARGGTVERITLVVTPDDTSAAGLARGYEQVRKALVDRLGPAAVLHDLGEFTAQASLDMAAGRLVRAMDWPTPHGLLRLGVPRRSAGQLRIELTHAAALPPPRTTPWGLDALR